MARGRSEREWDHTSVLLAKLHNLWCEDGEQLAPADFHPFRKPREEAVPRDVAPISVLKQMYCRG